MQEQKIEEIAQHSVIKKIRKQIDFDVPAGYTFQIPPQKMNQRYQLSLIRDSKVQKLLDDAVLVDTFDEKKHGWLKRSTHDKIRKRMKKIVEDWVAKIKKEGRGWIEKAKKR